MFWLRQATENLSMLLETARGLCDKVNYADEDSSVNPAAIRQHVAENNVSLRAESFVHLRIAREIVSSQLTTTKIQQRCELEEMHYYVSWPL
jgi:hypothetical protein